MHCPSSSPRNHPILEFGGLPWLLESAAKYLRSSGVVMTLKEGVSEKDGILSGGGGGLHFRMRTGPDTIHGAILSPFLRIDSTVKKSFDYGTVGELPFRARDGLALA